jgi:hypothetical protein
LFDEGTEKDKTMKTMLTGLALVLCISAVACAPAETGARPTTTTSAELVDGRGFLAEASLPDGSKISSELSFAKGVFDSSACEKMGYSAGPYIARRDGDAIAFRAQMKGKDGVETWNGRIVGDVVEGTVQGPDGSILPFHGKAR